MPVRPLSPELAEIAREKLGEDSEKKLLDGIQHLKDWIAKQPHLHARTDDQWLASWIRLCKFSLEKAKQRIDSYYTLRTLAPDVCSLSTKESRFFDLIKSGVLLVLPQTVSPNGPIVVIMRGRELNSQKLQLSEVISAGYILNKVLVMDNDNFVVSGIILVVETDGFPAACLTDLTPTKIKKYVVVSQKGLPWRVQASHVFDDSSMFSPMSTFVKLFFTEKIKKRLYFHNSFESIYEKISPEILPKEYGGLGSSTQEIIDCMVKKMEEYRTWLVEDEEFRTDESKRPGKPSTSLEMFGVDGSFRQLSFD